jgi:hypothetical protein
MLSELHHSNYTVEELEEVRRHSAITDSSKTIDLTSDNYENAPVNIQRYNCEEESEKTSKDDMAVNSTSTVIGNNIKSTDNSSESCLPLEKEVIFTEKVMDKQDNEHSGNETVANHTDAANRNNDLYDSYYKEVQDMLSELDHSKYKVEELDEVRRDSAIADSSKTIDLTRDIYEHVPVNVQRYNSKDEGKIYGKTNTHIVNSAIKSAKQRIADRFNLLRPRKSTRHFETEKNIAAEQVYNQKRDICEEQVESEVWIVTKQSVNNPVDIQSEPETHAYNTESTLTTNINDNTTKKIHECSLCNKMFRRKNDLKIHLRTHIAVKPYQCLYSDKELADKSVLDVHLRTHTGEKPYECSYCDKAFTQKGNLSRHLRTHTGEKPYECSYCDKAFAVKSNLSRHLRTHTGEKPYECSYCDKTFTVKSNLGRHLKIHQC